MAERYTRTAIFLHWLLFVGIAGALSLGLYMHDLHLSPTKIRLYNYHKWTGVTILVLVLIRLVWRAWHRPPALPAQMTPLLRLASHLTHLALYLLMLAIPISGWLMSSAQGFQTVWFGIIPLPNLVAKNEALGHQLHELHENLAYVLIGLVILHAAAALKHHFIDKDDVLLRMSPRHGNR